MKKLLIILLVLGASLQLFGQNEYNYVIYAYGGLKIGTEATIADMAKVDSVKLVSGDLVFYAGGVPYTAVSGSEDYMVYGDTAAMLEPYSNALLDSTWTSITTDTIYSSNGELYIDTSVYLNGDLEVTGEINPFPDTIDMDDYYSADYSIAGGSVFYNSGGSSYISPNTIPANHWMEINSDTFYLDNFSRAWRGKRNERHVDGAMTIGPATVTNESNWLFLHDFESPTDVDGLTVGVILNPDDNDTIIVSDEMTGFKVQVKGYDPGTNSRVDVGAITVLDVYAIAEPEMAVDSIMMLEIRPNDNGMPVDSITAYYGIYHGNNSVSDEIHGKDRTYFLYSEYGDNYLNGDLEVTGEINPFPDTIDMVDYPISGVDAYYANQETTVVNLESGKHNFINLLRDTIEVSGDGSSYAFTYDNRVYDFKDDLAMTIIREEAKWTELRNIIAPNAYFDGLTRSINLKPLAGDTIKTKEVTVSSTHLTSSTTDATGIADIGEAVVSELYGYLDDYVVVDSLIALKINLNSTGIDPDSIGAYYGIYHDGSGTPLQGAERTYFLYSEYGDNYLNGDLEVTGLTESEAFLKKDIITESGYITVYIDEVDGDDIIGDGSSGDPYQTTQRAVESLIEYDFIGSYYPLVLEYAAGTYDATEIFPYISQLNSTRVFIHGEATPIDTINVTHNGTDSYFNFSTDSTLVGDLNGKFLATGNISSLGLLAWPIVSNTTNDFVIPATSSLIGVDRYIYEHATKFEFPVYSRMIYEGLIEFRNIEFTEIAANSNFTFTNNDQIGFYNCKLSQVNPAGTGLGVSDLYFRGSMLEHTSASSGSQAMGGRRAAIYESYITSSNAQSQGSVMTQLTSNNFIQSKHVVYEGFGDVFLDQGGSSISIGSTYAIDSDVLFSLASGEAFLSEVNGIASGFDSIICDNVTDLFYFDESWNSSKQIYFPNLKVGGYTNFSATGNYSNNTMDLGELYTIAVGSGVHTLKVDTLEVSDSLFLPDLQELQQAKTLYYNPATGGVSYGDTVVGGGAGAGDLLSTNNLSDLDDDSTSRENLDVLSKADVDSTIVELSAYLEEPSFYGDWETGVITGGYNQFSWRYKEEDVADGRITLITSDSARQGNIYARFEVQSGDEAGGAERAEVSGMDDYTHTRIIEDDSSGIVRYEFSVYFPIGWDTIYETTPDEGAWGTFIQLHPGLGTNGPCWSFSAKDQIYFDLRAGDQSGGEVRTTYELSDGSLNLGDWIDFIVTVNYKKDSTGFVNVLRRNEGDENFTQMVDDRDIPTLQWDATINSGEVPDHNMKHGFYRNPQSFTSVLYLDGFTRTEVRYAEKGGGIYNRNDGKLSGGPYVSLMDYFYANYGEDEQANDDYEVDVKGASALVEGMTITFKANTANTGGATLEITSIGYQDAILKMNDQALATGDIEAGQIVVCVWDGSNWQMTSQIAQ